MRTLTLISVVIDDEDYDGNPVQFKRTTGTITDDSIDPNKVDVVAYVQACPYDTPDETCQTDYKATITDMGYTWDAEA